MRRIVSEGGRPLAPGLLVLALDPGSVRADDNGFFGRLFRLGGNPSSSSNSPSFPASAGNPGRSGNTAASNRLSDSAYGDIGSGGTFIPPAPTTARAPSPTPASGPIAAEGPSTPELGSSGDSSPRLTPRPRVSNAVTTADPLLTRLALGRSNDGSQFGMILQVFADGTVIDSEGVHRLSASEIRPLAEAIQNGDLSRVRGHCGTPSNDFIEYVHIVVFERRMGRLQAHSFSYAGNPQGCDNAIRYLHTALENIQAKFEPPACRGGLDALRSGSRLDQPRRRPPVAFGARHCDLSATSGTLRTVFAGDRDSADTGSPSLEGRTEPL